MDNATINKEICFCSQVFAAAFTRPVAHVRLLGLEQGDEVQLGGSVGEEVQEAVRPQREAQRTSREHGCPNNHNNTENSRERNVRYTELEIIFNFKTSIVGPSLTTSCDIGFE